MLINAETYEKHNDELEMPRPPRNYLDNTLIGRVHWISLNGQTVMAYFWEADNPGVIEGRADGHLGDAESSSEEEVLVSHDVEGKRFHVAVRVRGHMIKVTEGGSRRIWRSGKGR